MICSTVDKIQRNWKSVPVKVLVANNIIYYSQLSTMLISIVASDWLFNICLFKEFLSGAAICTSL